MTLEERDRPRDALGLTGETRELVLHRLRRLEGQARGVQRMVLEGRNCREVLRQITAIQAAARSLGALVLEHYLLSCLQEVSGAADAREPLEVVHEAIRGIAR